MNTIQHQFVYDDQGKKTFALLPIGDYEAMLEALDEAEDALLYDQAKREDDGAYISLEDMKTRLGLS